MNGGRSRYEDLDRQEADRLANIGLRIDDRVTVSLTDGKAALGGHVIAALPGALVVQGADAEATSIPWQAITAITRITTAAHPAT